MAEKGNNYYYDGGYIKPELVTTDAKGWADKFVPDKKDPAAANKDRTKMNASQLRRFYGDVKNLEMRWKNSNENEKQAAFFEILPMIKLLKAKTAYSCERKLIPESFKTWMGENVDRIKNEADFKAFLLYFEAVVGFCYGNGLKD